MNRLRISLRRPAFWLTAIGWVAVAAFALISVGAPLLGDGTFLASGLLSRLAPWMTELHTTTQSTSIWQQDTIDSATPQISLIVEAAKHGVFGQWNPFLAGGTQLGGLPNSGLYSPLSLPWWILPLTYAPGVVQVLQIAVAAVGMSLFSRRIGVPAVVWPVASLLFSTSAFMIAWNGWPQTRVAAFIPLLFWAIDRAVVRLHWVECVITGLVVAAILLGGFPAVAAFAFMAGAGYAIYRAIVVHRNVRRVLLSIAVPIGGLVVGFLFSAAMMVPFAVNASSFIDFEARSPGGSKTSSWVDLSTSVVPGILGDTTLGGNWGFALNPIESFSYVGVAAVVLIIASAIIRPRWRLDRGLIFFSILAVVCIWLIFGSGPINDAVSKLPVFSSNPIGRLRSVMGFALAMVAAFGYAFVVAPLVRPESTGVGLGTVSQTLSATGNPSVVGASDEWGSGSKPLLPGRSVRAARFPRFGLGLRIVIAILIACAAGGAVVLGWRTVPVSESGTVKGEILASVAIGVVAAAVVVLSLLTGKKWAAVLATIVIPVLVLTPALAITGTWWPKSDLSTFYPQTAAHKYLEGHIGGERFAAVGATMLSGTNSYYELRSLGGHTFTTAEWRALELKIDPKSFSSSTFSSLTRTDLAKAIVSPIMDRLGAKYVVDDPTDTPLGTVEMGERATGTAGVASGGSVRTASHTGAVNGIIFSLDPLAPTSKGEWVTTTLHSADGGTISSTKTWYGALSTTMSVALKGSAIAEGTRWYATVTVTGQQQPLPLHATSDGGLAVKIVRPDNADERIVHTGDATIYERTTALNRVRWASSSVIGTTESQRVTKLNEASLPDDTVVLNSGAAVAGSSTGTVKELSTNLNQLRFDVTADGSGWVVIGDSLRAPGWTATVDGKPATLLAADEAGGAVEVGAGHHTVVLSYETPGLKAGLIVTGVSVLFAVIAVVWLLVRRRRGRRRSGSSQVD